jgi:hypothetical protein
MQMFHFSMPIAIDYYLTRLIKPKVAFVLMKPLEYSHVYVIGSLQHSLRERPYGLVPILRQ